MPVAAMKPAHSSDRRTTAYMDRFGSALQLQGVKGIHDDRYISHYTTCAKPAAPAVHVEPLPPTKAPTATPSTSSWDARHKLDLSDRNLICIATRGNEVVVGGADHGLKVVSLHDPDCPRVVRTLYSKKCGHSEWVTTVDYLSDGRIVSGGMDSKICFWSGVTCKDLLGHVGSVSRVRPLGTKHIVSSSYDRSVKVWCSRSGKLLSSLHGHTGGILDFVIPSDGTIATAGRDSTVRVWDISQGKQMAKFDGHKGHVTALADAGSGLIVTGGQDARIRMWDTRQRIPVQSKELFSPGAAVTNIEVGCESGRIVAIGSDRKVCVLDGPVGGFAAYAQWDGDHGNFIYSAKSVGGDLVITGGGDGTVSIRSEAGKIQGKVKADDNAIRCISITDSGTVATATDDGNLVTF